MEKPISDELLNFGKNITLHRLLISAFAIWLPCVGYGALEFTGYMRDKHVLRFVVTDADSAQHS